MAVPPKPSFASSSSLVSASPLPFLLGMETVSATILRCRPILEHPFIAARPDGMPRSIPLRHGIPTRRFGGSRRRSQDGSEQRPAPRGEFTRPNEDRSAFADCQGRAGQQPATRAMPITTRKSPARSGSGVEGSTMGQVLHGSATTTEAVRRAAQDVRAGGSLLWGRRFSPRVHREISQIACRREPTHRSCESIGPWWRSKR